MNRQLRRASSAYLRQENSKQDDFLTMVPQSKWPTNERNMIALWRSKSFLVQVYAEQDSIIRLSICRTTINQSGEWDDNISWDELQEIKNQCGYAHLDAVEIYPRQRDLVNVANLRHLWVMPNKIAFAWRQ